MSKNNNNEQPKKESLVSKYWDGAAIGGLSGYGVATANIHNVTNRLVDQNSIDIDIPKVSITEFLDFIQEHSTDDYMKQVLTNAGVDPTHYSASKHIEIDPITKALKLSATAKTTLPEISTALSKANKRVTPILIAGGAVAGVAGDMAKDKALGLYSRHKARKNENSAVSIDNKIAESIEYDLTKEAGVITAAKTIGAATKSVGNAITNAAKSVPAIEKTTKTVKASANAAVDNLPPVVKPLVKAQGKIMTDTMKSPLGVGLVGAGFAMAPNKGEFVTDMVVPLKNEVKQFGTDVKNSFTNPLNKSASDSTQPEVDEAASEIYRKYLIPGAAALGGATLGATAIKLLDSKITDTQIHAATDAAGKAGQKAFTGAVRAGLRKSPITRGLAGGMKVSNPGKPSISGLLTGAGVLAASALAENMITDAIIKQSKKPKWDEESERAAYESMQKQAGDRTVRFIDSYLKSVGKGAAYTLPVAGASALIGKNLFYGMEPIQKQKDNQRIVIELPEVVKQPPIEDKPQEKTAGVMDKAEDSLRKHFNSSSDPLSKWSRRVDKAKRTDFPNDTAQYLTEDLVNEVAKGAGIVTPGAIIGGVLHKNVRDGFSDIQQHDESDGRPRIIIEQPGREFNRGVSVPVEFSKSAALGFEGDADESEEEMPVVDTVSTESIAKRISEQINTYLGVDEDRDPKTEPFITNNIKRKHAMGGVNA